MNYITGIVVLLLSIYAWITKRKLDAAKNSKLDDTLDKLNKGLKVKRKDVKDAKENYHSTRDAYGRIKPRKDV